MRNIFKKSLLFIATGFMASTIGAQTTVTWTPTEADVTALTNTSVHVITIGAGTQSFQVYSIRPFFNSSQVKLAWDASANAIKMTDNGIDKAGLAIYIPANSDDVQKITVYMHTTGSRKTLYADGKTCPNSGTPTTSAIDKTPTAYNFWSAPFQKDWYYAFGGRKDGSGESYYDKIEVVFAGPAGPVAVSGVSLNKTATSIEAGQSEQLTATVSPAGADDPSVSWASDNTSVATVDQNGNVSALAPGTATITVTTTDGHKTATCTVTVTAPPAPIDVQSISMKSATTIGIGASETLTVTYNPADANTNKALSWSSNNTSVATVDANGTVTGVAAGTATITATTANGKTATCSVTVQAVAVTGVSLDKVSTTLQVGAKETLTAIITPSNASNQNVTWESSMPSVATVNNGQITAVSAGSTNITVTTQDGNHQASCAVTVSAAPPVPSTSLTTHVPEIYEEKEIAGGYNGTLSVVNGREYEVYYASFTEEGQLSVTVTPVQKSNGITTPLSDYHCKANDGWLEMETSTSKSNYTMSAIEEFAAGSSAVHKLLNNAYYKMHIKGFDQFSFYGKDNNADASKGKHFEVYVDGMLQPMTLASSAKIRRFDISTGEHVIEVRGIGGSNNEFYGFSLRAAQQPRTKYLKGNDSTQVVYQTQAIKPVVYTTKYNNIDGAETRLEWTGTEATGISLSKIVGDISDTLTLTGTANCPVGTYNYAVVAYYNNVEINRVTGKFYVKSDIKAASDINVTVFNNEAMDQIKFKYYALDASAVQLNWGANGQPSGVSGSGANGIYTISGTPTITGTLPQDFPYSITVAGADTVIQGKITIKELVHTDRDVLYLYKNTDAYNTPIYNYLKTQGWNPIERTAADDVRPANQYGYYKWILISEDVDANTPEVIKIIQGEVNLPVLNLKGFTYAAGAGRLGWGEPDNGAIDTMDVKTKGTKIYIQNINHPIFKSNASFSGKHVGDSIAILSNYTRRGVMPIAIDLPGSLCLATGYTRNIDDYYAYGELQTSIHEVLPNSEARNNSPQKYICMPIGGQATLSNDGKSLLNSIITYLLDNTPVSITRPVLELQSFVIKHNTGDVIGAIDQTENTITLNMTIDQYREMDSLRSVTPQVTLAEPTATRVIPSENVDLRFAQFMAKEFVVTDFINRRVYNLKIRFPQGIENVEYEEGQWVNIFDMYGRKVATTNESIYTIDLPRGIYIIVTENGNTIKLSR